MENGSMGAQDGHAFPTLEQVYAAIMSNKDKAQERLPPQPLQPDPVVRAPSGLRGSLRNNTLEQLLLQGLGAAPDDHAGPLSIMRSNTIENILRGTLSTGKELQDLILDWSHHPAEEQRLVEGLTSDMQAIDAAPPDVATLRRTFTLERILSGAEADLASVLRPHPPPAAAAAAAAAAPAGGGHAQGHGNGSGAALGRQLSGLQQQGHSLHRQLSGASAAAASAGGGGGGGGGGAEAGGGGGEAGPSGRQAGRPGERLSRQESLHRLAASTGPGQHPLTRPAAAASGGGAAPPSLPGRGSGGLLRSGPGSGRTLLKLRAEAESLSRDNGLLSGQLETILGAVDGLQQRNGRMKQMLLEACRAKGIQADLDLLNVSLQHHRPPAGSEAAAASVAARVLALNGGDVAATVKQLLGAALGRAAGGGGSYR
ncbi:hypothetical protein GPECTOR_21g643 [Gonium pectorale]|uniref:Uncharacterized protein n=1 Tax=Gonium pectorale TaxID=33097 RepID=A0A150GHX2_GONPE|nr:hypothetical protein GPECTOR_21g643 [Gonium pectorale]|eukprot:KXZ49417.1 hypothetical protein GPECTOR_21g643 [Gonium pectorale]